MDLDHHRAWYQEPHAGGLGWSFPAALGMSLADRDRLVVATMGDGSYIFANPVACHQIAEALALPVLVVIVNNGEWGAVRQSVLGIYPDGHAARTNAMPLTRARAGAGLLPRRGGEPGVGAAGGDRGGAAGGARGGAGARAGGADAGAARRAGPGVARRKRAPCRPFATPG